MQDRTKRDKEKLIKVKMSLTGKTANRLSAQISLGPKANRNQKVCQKSLAIHSQKTLKFIYIEKHGYKIRERERERERSNSNLCFPLPALQGSNWRNK